MSWIDMAKFYIPNKMLKQKASVIGHIMSSKPLFFLLFILSSLAGAETTYAPGLVALKFNQWYIAQLDQNKPPVLNPDIMNEYVASGTIAAIKEMYSGDSNDKDMPDAHNFTKLQDCDIDSNHITV